MSVPRLFAHVVDPREASREHGMVAELVAHREMHPDWDTCGFVAPPGYPCSAFSEGTGERCGKRAAVVRLDGRTKGARLDSEPTHAVFLCGGHLIVHRSGKAVRIAVVLARGAA